MNKFDIKSAKFMIFIIIICGAFAALVGNAYRYLPSEDNKKDYVQFEQKENSNFVAEEKNDKEYEEKTSVEKDEEVIEEKRNTKFEEEKKEEIQEKKDIEEFEVIGNNIPKNDELTIVLNNAKKSFSDKNFTKAVEEYQNALTLTSDNKIKAECYEQIASIQAISKRYGTALSYAQKAFNMEPTTSREVLLARLYYKTGNTERANQRMNNVLQRDFSMDK